MNPVYEKHENESDYEYGLRLIKEKVEKNPEDLDWQDIVDLTGLDCHRDSLRKAANVTPYSGYSVMKYFLEKNAAGNTDSPDDYLRELDERTIEFKKERQRFFDQRREYNKIIRDIGRGEYLEESLIAAANNLNTILPLNPSKRELDTSDNEAVLVFADWHYGMVADNVWQKYNTSECRRRVENVVSAAYERIQFHQCRKLHVIILGDTCHGSIHTSARVASEELTCDQIMQVSEILAEAISTLADLVPETIVYATYGNHLRTIQNKSDSIHRDNMERLIPWWIKERVSTRDDITFSNDSGNEFITLKVCGYNICATHGDLDKVKSSGRMLNTLFSKKYGSALDYILLADKHHTEEFEELGVETILVRALCGSDEYANLKRLYSTPGQLMMIFNDTVGRDASYNLSVD